jgi:TonB family protein
MEELCTHNVEKPAVEGSQTSSNNTPNPFHGSIFLTSAIQEKPIWTGLYETVHDSLFPPRLPPLELTSTPIPTPDRMAAKTNPWAVGTATIANGSILALIILLGLRTAIYSSPHPPTSDIHLKDFTLFAPPTAQPAHGGGGGANELIDPNIGRLPQREEMPLTPPQVPILDHPQLAIDPAIAVPIDIKLPDNPSLPNIGVHTSPNVTLLSAGQGGPTGIGKGSDGDYGPGKGPNGWGPGSDGGVCGGVCTAGVGGVSNPIPIVTPEAEFSDEARRQKYQGVCMISIIVDTHGYPQDPRVIQPLGMGLDEKALAAVKLYRFKPALKDGKPVNARIWVAVNFRLY